MTATKKPAPFQIIRHRGKPKEGTLPDGTKVYAQDKFWFEEVGKLVPAAPYHDAFIFEVTDVRIKGPRFRCSCGSFAVCAGYSAYEKDASPQNLLFVCYQHATTGQHATGGTRWI